MAEVDWKDYIHSVPEVLRGKPVVKGTRLSVEFILGLFAEGWTEQKVIGNYPALKKKNPFAPFLPFPRRACAKSRYTLFRPVAQYEKGCFPRKVKRDHSPDRRGSETR